MKKSFFLVLVYFIFFLFIDVFSAFIYMENNLLTGLVIGSPFVFFDFSIFKDGILFFMAYSAVAAMIPTIMYLIKHSHKLVQSLIPYVCLCFAVWFGLVPLGFHLSQKYDISLEEKEYKTKTLTNGYFRQNGECIDYYINSNPDGSSRVLRYAGPSVSDPVQKISVVNINPEKENKTMYSEPVVRKTFEKGLFPKWFGDLLTVLDFKARGTLNNGYLHYLLFAVIGFAFSSVIGLIRCSHWRLLNGLMVIVGFIFIVCLNGLLYTPYLYVRFNIPISFMNWIPLTFNIVTGVAFTIIGIVNIVKQPNPNRENEE